MRKKMMLLVGGLLLLLTTPAQTEPNQTEPNQTKPTGLLQAVPSQEPAYDSPMKLLIIGDSLTQGYGVRSEQAFPAVLGRLLAAKGYKVQVINGGVSGSVTAEADKRLRWYLKVKPKIVVIALGANDGLKGTPAKVIEDNLERAIQLAKASRIRVVLAGLKIFTNFGEDYVKAFDAVFPRLAKKHQLVFLPFLLEGVALKSELNQPDGRHPNDEGHKRIAENLVKLIEPMLKQSAAMSAQAPAETKPEAE